MRRPTALLLLALAACGGTEFDEDQVDNQDDATVRYQFDCHMAQGQTAAGRAAQGPQARPLHPRKDPIRLPVWNNSGPACVEGTEDGVPSGRSAGRRENPLLDHHEAAL
jgi:hypothetical protein